MSFFNIEENVWSKPLIGGDICRLDSDNNIIKLKNDE